MIPFFQIPSIQFLGLSIHAFEILTSIGIFLGIRTVFKMAERKNLQNKIVVDEILVSMLFGFFGAHWMHVWLYEKDFTHPLRLLNLAQGISSTGGIFVGAVACWIFLRIKKVPVLQYGEPIIYGLTIAMFWGRLGCTIAHDHLGSLTTFPLGVQYPQGTRHNLGMYEAIFLGILLLLIRLPYRSWLDQKTGRYIAIASLYYGFIRFGLDFLRAKDLPISDVRYVGLTPAQYICLLLITAGFCLIYKLRSIK